MNIRVFILVDNEAFHANLNTDSYVNFLELTHTILQIPTYCTKE